MDMMDNMRYYNAGREVPDAAKKTIKAGKLSGFTAVSYTHLDVYKRQV